MALATIHRISEPRDISYLVLTNQQDHDSAVSLSYLFLKWWTTFRIWHRLTRTNLYSLWPLLQKKWKTSVFDKGNPSVKVIDRWWSAYANAVITVLVRIMITYYGKLNNKKIAAQMLLGQEAICKTSFGWIYGHQYYVILAKVLFLFCFVLFFSRKAKLCLGFFLHYDFVT